MAVQSPAHPLLSNLEVPLGLSMPTDAHGCSGGKLVPPSLKRHDIRLCCINCCETNTFLFLPGLSSPGLSSASGLA